LDPLAHTLCGAAIAACSKEPRGRFTTALLVIGANLPDVDVLSYAWGPDAALGFRRGWTHGVLALAVWPFLLIAAERGLARLTATPRAGRSFLLLAGLAVWSHPVLDYFNTYGIRLLMPFDERWFYGDALFIVDPWLWLLLGLATYAGFGGRPHLRRAVATLAVAATLLVATAPLPLAGKGLWAVALAGAVVYARACSRPELAAGKRRRVRAFLCLAGLYAASLLVSGWLARSFVALELARQGQAPRRLMVGPQPLTPFSRQVIAATGSTYLPATFHWLPSPHLITSSRRLAPPPDEPRVNAALASPSVRGFVAWARFPWAELEESGRGTTVFLLDARYTLERTSGFGGASVFLPARSP
jgi:inner membrane protein